MAAVLASIFAHQGGWDEALLVATPVLVIGVLLVLANRRASHALASMHDDAAAAEPHDSPRSDDGPLAANGPLSDDSPAPHDGPAGKHGRAGAVDEVGDR